MWFVGTFDEARAAAKAHDAEYQPAFGTDLYRGADDDEDGVCSLLVWQSANDGEDTAELAARPLDLREGTR